MSKRNTLEAKRTRWSDRLFSSQPARIPVGNDLPDDLDRLTDPKGKPGMPARKRMLRARASTLDMPEFTRPTAKEKAQAVLSRLSMAQLYRRMHQYAVRASGAHHKIEALAEDSRFALPLQNLHRINCALFALAQEEIARRTKPSFIK